MHGAYICANSLLSFFQNIVIVFQMQASRMEAVTMKGILTLINDKLSAEVAAIGETDGLQIKEILKTGLS